MNAFQSNFKGNQKSCDSFPCKTKFGKVVSKVENEIPQIVIQGRAFEPAREFMDKEAFHFQRHPFRGPLSRLLPIPYPVPIFNGQSGGIRSSCSLVKIARALIR